MIKCKKCNPEPGPSQVSKTHGCFKTLSSPHISKGCVSDHSHYKGFEVHRNICHCYYLRNKVWCCAKIIHKAAHPYHATVTEEAVFTSVNNKEEKDNEAMQLYLCSA
jgi:hypothetical protein